MRVLGQAVPRAHHSNGSAEPQLAAATIGDHIKAQRPQRRLRLFGHVGELKIDPRRRWSLHRRQSNQMVLHVDRRLHIAAVIAQVARSAGGYRYELRVLLNQKAVPDWDTAQVALSKRLPRSCSTTRRRSQKSRKSGFGSGVTWTHRRRYCPPTLADLMEKPL